MEDGLAALRERARTCGNPGTEKGACLNSIRITCGNTGTKSGEAGRASSVTRVSMSVVNVTTLSACASGRSTYQDYPLCCSPDRVKGGPSFCTRTTTRFNSRARHAHGDAHMQFQRRCADAQAALTEREACADSGLAADRVDLCQQPIELLAPHRAVGAPLLGRAWCLGVQGFAKAVPGGPGARCLECQTDGALCPSMLNTGGS